MDLVKEANALAAEGKTEEALGLYGEAVRKNPGDVRGHCGLAALHLDAGRYVEAAECAEQLARMRPSEAWPHGILGIARSLSGRKREALDCYQKLKMFPLTGTARFGLAGAQWTTCLRMRDVSARTAQRAGSEHRHRAARAQIRRGARRRP